MTPQLVSGSVLWTPPVDIVLADGARSPTLEFAALKPVDLTDSHGIDITLARLEEMVAAYDPAVEMASLNLDHNYRGPSHGWCERLWLQSGELWVRYVDLDPSTVELIRTKRYTRRSAELALDHPVTGGWYFTGCALLGNARPAVAGLPPVTLDRPQYVLTPRKENPVPQPDPPAPPAPPAQPAGEAELAAFRTQAAESDRLFLELRRQNAELSVEKRLAQLGSRVTPAMARIARPLLIELLAVRTPATVSLQLDPAKPPADVSVADQILEILAAVPAVEALTSGRLADEVAVAGEAGTGLSDERFRELDARYSFTRTAFGFRGN